MLFHFFPEQWLQLFFQRRVHLNHNNELEVLLSDRYTASIFLLSIQRSNDGPALLQDFCKDRMPLCQTIYLLSAA